MSSSKEEGQSFGNSGQLPLWCFMSLFYHDQMEVLLS